MNEKPNRTGRELDQWTGNTTPNKKNTEIKEETRDHSWNWEVGMYRQRQTTSWWCPKDICYQRWSKETQCGHSLTSGYMASWHMHTKRGLHFLLARDTILHIWGKGWVLWKPHCSHQDYPLSGQPVLLGDFNARVGVDHDLCLPCLGHHGIGNINENRQQLIKHCSHHDLCMTNSYFQTKPQHKVLWRHPQSKCWHQLDLIIFRHIFLKFVLLNCLYHSADFDMDHSLVYAGSGWIQQNSSAPCKKESCSSTLQKWRT